MLTNEIRVETKDNLKWMARWLYLNNDFVVCVCFMHWLR